MIEATSEHSKTFMSFRDAWASRLAGGEDGLTLARALTAATDAWIINTWHELSDGVDGELVAVGGYGRGELAFHSDIDLVVHVQDATSPELRFAMEQFHKHVRETRMKVAVAVRTPEQFKDEIQKDVRTAISYLDVRPLQDADTDELRASAIRLLRGSDMGLDFVVQLFEGFRTRRDRFGKTVYRLEPDIKSGLGGLRDAQSLRWAADVCFDTDPLLNEIPNVGWAEVDRARLEAALSWLYNIRQRLHVRHGRRNDRMHFDDQEAIAHQLRDDGDVELLMQEHYQFAKSLWQLTERNLRMWGQRTTPFISVGTCFRVDESLISLDATTNPMKPEQVFEALRLASEHSVLLEPELEKSIATSVVNWDDTILGESGVGSGLAEVLTDVNITSRTSTRLLDLGVLARIVPEFSPLICHMQHDVYHVYTTDVHSVRCLEAGRALLRSSTESLSNRWPWVQHVAAEISDATVFLLSCLFHDIGKNRGGGHSAKGAAMMVDVGPRLGLSESQTDTLRFLVLEHLTLSQTARRRDISDVDLIREIAQTVGSKERLDLLLCLTFCDAFTVGDDVMTDWTASLLNELYLRVLAEIQGKAVEVSSDKFLNLLGESEFASEFVSDMPDGLLRGLSDPDLHRYAAIYAQAKRDGGTVVSFSSDSQTKSTEVIVATDDQPGLLASISGALSASGMDILSGQIISTNDGRTFDIFRITRAGRAVDDERRLDSTRQLLTDVLAGTSDVRQILETKRQEQRLPPRARPAVATKIRVVDETKEHTILEVRTGDRPGLLFDITSGLQGEGVNIHQSFIDSEGDQVVDTFYIEELEGGPLDDARSAEVIAALRALIDPA